VICGTEKLTSAMGELSEMGTLSAALDLTDAGAPPEELYRAMLEGVREVDRRYEAGEYFIADLIMAGHILRSVMVTVPGFAEQAPHRGEKVLLCNLGSKGLDLGLSVLSDILRQNGFLVTVLWEDPTAEDLTGAIRGLRPGILVFSVAGGKQMLALRERIRAVEKLPERSDLRILLAGSGVRDLSPRALGADGKSLGLFDSLRLCLGFPGEGPEEKP